MNRRIFETASIGTCLMLFLGSMAIAAIDSDNSKVNKRDQNMNELTADQQGAVRSDVEITRRIRQDLVQNKSLSVYAHNVKIITVDGRVTLKGPVKSSEEQDVILSTAQDIAGLSNVENKMSVATK